MEIILDKYLIPEDTKGTFTRMQFQIDTVSWPRNRRVHDRFQIDAVLPFWAVYFTRPMKPYRFENTPLFTAFSKLSGFNVGLDQCRVNGRHNLSKAMRLQMKPYLCKHSLKEENSL